ncbi:protein kinase domain-containing protein [Rhodopirellula sp. SWK7]|uniref:protein kinase domain-containing protein n=1 Tax=Rhodopirellula sp. SWK7 TaxID=595460 RepID=UPI0002BF4112|nr:protein kinase [Rhodopirellula sp. SWK7]EMI44824.1 serine/threonine protein kinase with PASTA sensor(s) [Rhodopirellula sp. SWK7]
MAKGNQLTPDDLATVDQLCDEFEIAWLLSGGRESLNQWVEKAPAPLRSKMFAELLALDGQLRTRQSESSFMCSLSRICPFDVVMPDPDESSFLGEGRLASISTARHALIDCPTFAGLTRTVAERLEDSFAESRFVKGDAVMTQGSPTQGLFIVLAGQLEIRKASGSGESAVLDHCGPGSVVGEMSLLSGETCTATVIATGDVQTLTLSAESFAELREEFPEIEIALSQLVSDRLGRREIDALCGRILGGYRLIRCIGRGGMGVIYECHPEHEPQRRVALKMLRHRFVHDAAVVDLFHRESEVLQNLRHRNVVEVYDSFVDVRTRFFVLELFDGTDLRQVLRQHGRLAEPTLRRLIGQIAAGLCHAHSQNVVHLDIKPENVLLDRTGRAALADFGLCQDLDQDQADLYIKGTPAYMAPEQLCGDAVTPSSDWYALGCVMAELATGRRLFQDRDPVNLLELKRATVPSADWPALNVSEELRDVLSGLIHPDPACRHWNADQLCAWADVTPELTAETASKDDSDATST